MWPCAYSTVSYVACLHFVQYGLTKWKALFNFTIYTIYNINTNMYIKYVCYIIYKYIYK